jgi:hypothetical protein
LSVDISVTINSIEANKETMPRGQTTSLTKANKTSESLRTTVPASIINQFDLKEGDRLQWILEPYKNELFIKIKPLKKSEKD